MNNKEWLEWRRKGIGSSDAAIIMGVSPWKTPYSLWQEKLFGISEESDNSSMKRGRDLEPTARAEFEKLMNVSVSPANVIHPKLDWVRASLDGIDINQKVLVEIKCPNREDHQLAAAGKQIPEKYYPQVQHQLLTTGLDGMYYFSFDGSQGAIVEVARDQPYIDRMLEEERKFWDMVLSEFPPELKESDYLCMEGNKEWKMQAKDLKAIREEKKALEEREGFVVQTLKSLAQGRSAKGYGLMMQKQICKGAVEYSKIPELKNVDLEKYRKKSFEKWPIRFIS